MSLPKSRSSKSISQTPGGNQTYSIFDPASSSPAAEINPRGKNVSRPTFAPPSAKAGIATPTNNPTYTPSSDSPFSSKPAESSASQRPYKAIETSSDSPFSAAPAPVRSPSRPSRMGEVSAAKTADSAPAPRDFKANKPSQESPFSNSKEAAQSIPRSPSKINNVSSNNPFLPESAASAPVERRIARSGSSTGSRQNINLFANEPSSAPSPSRADGKVSATFSTSVESPFSHQPAPAASKPSYQAKANVVSNEFPFTDKPYEASKPTYQAKANVPAIDSPWSSVDVPKVQRPPSSINKISNNSPFNQAAAEAPAAARNRPPPGGAQTFSVFSHEQ